MNIYHTDSVLKLKGRTKTGLAYYSRLRVSLAATRWSNLSGGLLLACCSLWLLTATPCSGALGLDAATSVSKVSGDDNNTSTLYTDGGGPQQVTSCPWIIPSLTGAGFTAANKWNFTFAGAAASQFFFNDITVNQYQAQTVNQGTFTDPGGTKWGGSFKNAEAGGAYLQLTYKPVGTDPTAVHWIQAVNSTYWGGGNAQSSIHLDGNGGASPFYDSFSAAGPTYFADVPFAPETNPNTGTEYENNPVANVQFQVFLAVDNQVGAVHNVTLYGGEWWGYQFTAVDAPEPGVLTLAGLGLFSLAFRRRRLTAGKRPSA